MLTRLQFIMGMDLMYERMPKKKWYIILDDDTFLIKPSLELFLSHLNPKHPYYIGNAVGDYKGRFAHGGSGVLISGAAMQRLFNHPDIVKSAYLNSLDETWGDKLVATTLQQVGVYIDERYNHHFNGESPELTRVTADRFCSPLISFHGLRGPGQMAAVGRTLATVRDPVLWGDLWQLFGPYAIQDLAREPAQRGQDHVGAGTEDERTKVWEGVETSEECRRRCGGSCLAWTWEEDKGRCLASPWMLIGSDGARGKTSGVNWSRVERLLWHCS
jgi:hypothetical protein